MVTVLLVALLFNLNTGEIVQAQGKGFETVEQCEQELASIVAGDLPIGYKVYAKCIVPTRISI